MPPGWSRSRAMSNRGPIPGEALSPHQQDHRDASATRPERYEPRPGQDRAVPLRHIPAAPEVASSAVGPLVPVPFVTQHPVDHREPPAATDRWHPVNPPLPAVGDFVHASILAPLPAPSLLVDAANREEVLAELAQWRPRAAVALVAHLLSIATSGHGHWPPPPPLAEVVRNDRDELPQQPDRRRPGHIEPAPDAPESTGHRWRALYETTARRGQTLHAADKSAPVGSKGARAGSSLPPLRTAETLRRYLRDWRRFHRDRATAPRSDRVPSPCDSTPAPVPFADEDRAGSPHLPKLGRSPAVAVSCSTVDRDASPPPYPFRFWKSVGDLEDIARTILWGPATNPATVLPIIR